MLISKPEWVVHKHDKLSQSAIYSVDIHPDGTRLATGSLDTRVLLWSMRPILSEAAEIDPDQPRLLASLTNHNGSVLCVRWSGGHGRYLASGSDDMIILIWQRDVEGEKASSLNSFGSSTSINGALNSGNKASSNNGGGGGGGGGLAGFIGGYGLDSSHSNIEHWKVTKRLTGHESDVIDLAWSPDGSYLASCGLDKSIFIWESLNGTFDCIRKLDRQHSGFVKGISFDPVGKYLASQSDDRSCKIWRTSDWSVCKEIKDPFKEANQTTFFTRPSWSPDGRNLALANAVNKHEQSVVIVSRESWNSDMSLLGHEYPINVARFCPRIFNQQSPSINNDVSGLFSVCAIGSSDCMLSLWRTGDAKSLTVVTDSFSQAILDISWTPDGAALVACSQDGSITVLQFNADEIGKPIPLTDHVQLMNEFGYGQRPINLPLAPEQIALDNQFNNMVSQQREKINNQSQVAAVPHSLQTHTNGTLASKLTTIQQTVQQPQTTATSVAPISALASVPVPVPSSTSTSASTSTSHSAPTVQQRVTITKDGKKRIQPQLVRGFADDSSGRSPSMLASSGDPLRDILQLSTASPQLQPVVQQPQPQVQQTQSQIQQTQSHQQAYISNALHPVLAVTYDPAMTYPALDESRKRAAAHIVDTSTNGTQPVASSSSSSSTAVKRQFASTATLKRNTAPAESFSTAASSFQTIPVDSSISARSSMISLASSASCLRLPVPRVQNLLRMISQSAQFTIECHNKLDSSYLSSTSASAPTTDPCRITLSISTGGPRQSLLWTAFIPGAATLIAADSHNASLLTENQQLHQHCPSRTSIMAVACEDSSVHVMSLQTSRILMPPIALEAPLSAMVCCAGRLLCLTCVGLLYVWDIVQRRAILHAVSIAPILELSVAHSSSQDSIVPVELEQTTCAASVGLRSINLRPDGTPHLTTLSGSSYIYDVDMRCWVRVSDGWTAALAQEYGVAMNDEHFKFTRASATAASASSIASPSQQPSSHAASSVSTISITGTQPQGPSSQLYHTQVGNLTAIVDGQSISRTGSSRARDQSIGMLQLYRKADAPSRDSLTLSTIERQLANTLALKSPDEYTYWLKCYAVRLARTNALSRATALCDELVGPFGLAEHRAGGGSGRSAIISLDDDDSHMDIDAPEHDQLSLHQPRRRSTAAWEPTLMDGQLRKRTLLAMILPILSQSVQLRPAAMEYARALERVAGG